MKKLFIIPLASVAAASALCFGCSTAKQQENILQWNSLKDGTFEKFSPKGEHPTPLPTTALTKAQIYDGYFNQTNLTNVIGNDIIYNQLAVYATTPQVDLTITPFAISSNKANKTISFIVNVLSKSGESPTDISIIVDNLYYDIGYDNENKILYFGADWLADNASPHWSDASWQIKVWMIGYKFTIDSVKKWSEWSESSKQTILAYTRIIPYYFKNCTIKI